MFYISGQMKATKGNNVVDETKTIVLGVRFSAAELQEIRECAGKAGHKMSTWVHWVAVKAARDTLDVEQSIRRAKKRR